MLEGWWSPPPRYSLVRGPGTSGCWRVSGRVLEAGLAVRRVKIITFGRSGSGAPDYWTVSSRLSGMLVVEQSFRSQFKDTF